MRLDVPREGVVILTLSELNLVSLLFRLRRGVAGALISENVYVRGSPLDGVTFAARAEPDTIHYRERVPGPMLPSTEAAIRWAQERSTADEGGEGPDPDAC